MSVAESIVNSLDDLNAACLLYTCLTTMNDIKNAGLQGDMQEYGEYMNIALLCIKRQRVFETYLEHFGVVYPLIEKGFKLYGNYLVS